MCSNMAVPRASFIIVETLFKLVKFISEVTLPDFKAIDLNMFTPTYVYSF